MLEAVYPPALLRYYAGLAEDAPFADVDNRSTIAREEIFGPVLSVIPYTDAALLPPLVALALVVAVKARHHRAEGRRAGAAGCDGSN